MKEGQQAQFTVEITEELVDQFAALSGDTNPLHVDAGYATAQGFEGRVAHGMISGALFSRLIGMYLPGEQALYLSQSLSFHQPIYPPCTVVVEGEVSRSIDAMDAIEISMSVVGGADETVYVTGRALVRIRS